ncbi:MFS transporter, NNP family, nitrate/nitrite transporter [Halogranum amylolyticum]|uniref:MFS transporter, NNP family, nitrate/nitrite transporter n=1 Tax=Halogranum amylolyticum TaxID=660520 RepID=A0A1H8VA36_9EURY|nr:MFS transporter [Halogranum amylolyticum]SEP12275.1 MFS transporter, NNP family, nitrate/nitrite transporter [Halogranum amylolyticum]
MTQVDDRIQYPQGSVALLIGMWLMWLFVGAYIIVPASVLSLLMTDFGIGETAASWILTAPQVSAVLIGIPVGIYLDRTNNRVMMAAAIGLILVASIWGWVAGINNDYWSLFVSRLLSGLAIVTIWVAGTNILSSAFPPEARSTAVSIYTTGYPLGYAIGQYAGPQIATEYGWPTTLLVFGSLAVTTLPFIIFAGQTVTASPDASHTPTRSDVFRVFLDRNVWVVCLVSFTIYSLYMVFNSWMPTYTSTMFDLSLAKSGLFVSLFPATAILSRTGGGILSDRVFNQRKRPVLFVSFLTTTIVVLYLSGADIPSTFLVGLVAAGLTIQLQMGVIYTYVQNFVDDNVVGTAVAVISVVGWLGEFVSPVITGALIEWTGEYSSIFVYTGVLGVIGTLVALLASE